jgi:hypothetical protein
MLNVSAASPAFLVHLILMCITEIGEGKLFCYPLTNTPVCMLDFFRTAYYDVGAKDGLTSVSLRLNNGQSWTMGRISEICSNLPGKDMEVFQPRLSAGADSLPARHV